VPVEPPATPWLFPDAGEIARREVDDLVAVGADLAPGTLLEAYRHGLFPMPGPAGHGRHGRPGGPGGHGGHGGHGGRGAPGRPVQWWSPEPRAVLPLDGLRVSRSLRRSCRDFEIRVDTAFADVLAGCADPARPQGWINADIAAAYTRLHELGWAHSVEAWQDGRLAGGLYGVAIGGLFAGESMFHRVRDASKVALVGLVELLNDGRPRLLDVQWCTPHLAGLGAREVPRADYFALLPAALELPLPAAFA